GVCHIPGNRRIADQCGGRQAEIQAGALCAVIAADRRADYGDVAGDGYALVVVTDRTFSRRKISGEDPSTATVGDRRSVERNGAKARPDATRRSEALVQRLVVRDRQRTNQQGALAGVVENGIAVAGCLT